MITKRITGRKDGRTSAAAALRYGEGLKRDRATGKYLDKSHRTRLGNFGLVDDGIYAGRDIEEMAELLDLAATEMQSNCDLNTKVGADKKIAHFIVSFNQTKPSEAVLRDTEDLMLAALKLGNNHFATFLHNDNGYWHAHMFVSRIDKVKHIGNPLWQDMTIRDRVCKEIELRYELERDNGLHRIDEAGQIVEVPREERRQRQALKPFITDKARSTEIHSGERTFQSWAEEIRIGDRLKHAKSWRELHAAAAAYGCEIKQKGAGFIICPLGEKGGIQLSKIGLKNLPAKFGAFQPANSNDQIKSETAYTPSPTYPKAASHYQIWREAKDAFKPVSVDRLNEQRETHKMIRQDLREKHKAELVSIRAETKGAGRSIAISIAKMQHVVALTNLNDQFSRERKALRQEIGAQGPGSTFRDFLIKEAEQGDTVALQLARKYGEIESTKVSRLREEGELKIVAVISGLDYQSAPRLKFQYRVERSGTVVFDLGLGRAITDNAVTKQVQLNDAAANSPETIETALRFATSKFGNTLNLTGSLEFQHLAVETAVRKGLNINFYDPALQAYKQQLTSTINHNYQEKTHVARTRPYQTLRIPPAHRRDRLHQLPELTLVSKSKDVEVLLPQNVPDRVADRIEAGRDGNGLRRLGGKGSKSSGLASRSPIELVQAAIKEQAQLATGSATELLQSENDQIHVAPSAHSAALEWDKSKHKEIVEPRPGDGQVPYSVIHIESEGIWLDMGRTRAFYQTPDTNGITVGSKVTVGKNMEILLQQKTFETGKER